MKITITTLFLLISIFSLAQTIPSEKPLIRQGIGYYVPSEYSATHEGFPFQMEVFIDKNGVWRFRNNTNKIVSVIIDFDNLVGVTPTVPLPFIDTFSPKVHKLFQLKHSGTSPINYHYNFYYTEGIVNVEASNYTYLLPVPNDKAVTLTTFNFDHKEVFISQIKYHMGFLNFMEWSSNQEILLPSRPSVVEKLNM